MLVIERLVKNVRCIKTNQTCMVQETARRLYKKQDYPDQVTHKYKCQNFSQCAECVNCQYHL